MKKPMFVVVMLAMVTVAIVPALAQDGAGSDMVPAEEPTATCATGPPDRIPGGFFVYYYSEEEMRAAPQENVMYTDVYYPAPRYLQTLHFEDIASIADPCERFAAEQAKLQEISAWSGVDLATYESYIPVIPAATAAG